MNKLYKVRLADGREFITTANVTEDAGTEVADALGIEDVPNVVAVTPLPSPWRYR